MGLDSLVDLLDQMTWLQFWQLIIGGMAAPMVIIGGLALADAISLGLLLIFRRRREPEEADLRG